MDALRLKALATEMGGVCQGDDVYVQGAAIDSRTVQAGNLFIALAGAQVDGHDYVDAAAQAGAAAALVTRFVDSPLPQWRVENPRRVLVELACRVRGLSAAQVVAVTGSNGKTTVKEMLAAIFTRVGRTQATPGNLNNELGVPLTLCRLNPDDRYAVIEMGCGQPGDIALLASWARPQVGLVNNVGPAHLARFGSLAAIAQCKGELFEALPADGWAVINVDDPFATLWERQAAHCRILRFSHSGQPAEVSASLQANGELQLRFPDGEVQVRLPLAGAHNQANALAAAAAAYAAGAPISAIAEGLASVSPVAGRLHARPGPAGSTIVDDSYNANPSSLAAALQTLTAEPGEVWLALGDMAELGDQAARWHAEAGQQARELGVQRLLGLGELSAHAVTAFGHGASQYDSHAAMADAIRQRLHPGVRVLVKGSRSAHMEAVVADLIQPEPKEDKACC